jgi:hypothetical protein
VFETTTLNLDKLDQAALTMTELWTSHATHDSTAPAGSALYPNVTFPNFSVAAGNLGALGNAKGIAIAPLVRSSERTGWETYAFDHQGWITEDLVTVVASHANGHTSHEGHSSEETVEVEPGTIHRTIYGSNPDSERYFPIWQIFPTPTDAFESPIMMDLQGLDWFPSAWKALEETRQHVFSPIVDLGPILSYHDFEDSDSEDQGSDDIRTLVEGGSSPQSVVLEPIFEGFDPASAQIVGVAIVFIEWRDLFSGLLEDEAAGMILDLEYSCPNEQHSTRYAFRTTADEDVVFVGENFERNPKYNYMAKREAVTGVTTDVSDSASDDRRLLQGEELESSDGVTGCSYFVSIYATDEYIENWQRNDAVIYTVVVCSIFIFTGLVFVLYDFMVQNRNRKVVRSAERSTAIVKSLFPKKVAEQMMEETSHRLAPRSSTIQALKAINAPSEQPTFSVAKKPIADLFKDTTIMFADIAGFTAWSSMREPAQVGFAQRCFFRFAMHLC